MNDRLLDHLRKVYIKAEIDIINEIARLRERGLVDYHAVAALKRVQGILQNLQDESWKYVPKIVEDEFYAVYPEKYTRAPKTVLEHLKGYVNARSLSIAATDIVARLVAACMGQITDATQTSMNNLSDIIIGRREDDIFRKVGLEVVQQIQATGQSLRAPNDFVERLRQEGVTAFVDKAGRAWNLHSYADMVVRTTSRQAETLAVLERYPTDLFMMSRNHSGCKVCAPLEGRVFSKSGGSPYYPPLADAFGKVDKNGPNVLSNTYLVVHPNCRHVLVPWTEKGKTPEEIAEARRFSNPKTNPYSIDPRTEQEKSAYNRRQRAREKVLRDFKQFELFRLAIPDVAPKTYNTFIKHKQANDEKYRLWLAVYRERTRES